MHYPSLELGGEGWSRQPPPSTWPEMRTGSPQKVMGAMTRGRGGCWYATPIQPSCRTESWDVMESSKEKDGDYG